MGDLEALKADYNKKLDRNKNAEEWFRTHTVKECLAQLELFNIVTRDLSKLMIEIENKIGRNLTKEEKLNGFKEVKDV